MLLFSIAMVFTIYAISMSKTSDICESHRSLEDDVSFLQSTVVATSAKVGRIPPHARDSSKQDRFVATRRERRSRRGSVDENLLVVSLSRSMQRTVEKVWGGMDLTTEEHDALSRAVEQSGSRRGHKQVKAVTSTRSKRLHLLGPPDSGTHLFVQSLQMNWPDEATEACRSSQMCDVSLWKHSISEESGIYDHLHRCGDQLCTEKIETNMSDTVVVAMVRSPISQMASWKKAAYSLAPCFERPWKEMQKPCWSNTSPLCHDSVPSCRPDMKSSESLEFSSSVDVYNRYMEEYLALQQDNRIGAIILLAYEDLVLTPDVELARIATAMGWELPERYSILEAEAKGDRSRNRDEALAHLDSREWLENVGHDNLRSLCGLLNATAVQGFAEGSHTSEPVPYLHDCAGMLSKS